jgi:hypothetical protein
LKPNKKLLQKAKETIEEVFDKQENFHRTLKDFEDKNGFVPAKYQKDIRLMAVYETYKKVGSWRENKYVKKMIKLTLDEYSKQKGFFDPDFEKWPAKVKESYLTKKMDQIFKDMKKALEKTKEVKDLD